MTGAYIATKAAKLIPSALAGDPLSITILTVAGIAIAVSAIKDK